MNAMKMDRRKFATGKIDRDRQWDHPRGTSILCMEWTSEIVEKKDFLYKKWFIKRFRSLVRAIKAAQQHHMAHVTAITSSL